MTGWRIGFTANRLLAPAFTKWVTNTDSCESHFAVGCRRRRQWPAARGRSDARQVLERRNLIVGLLNEAPGIQMQASGGAFYAWPNVTELCKMTGLADGEELRKRLLYEGRRRGPRGHPLRPPEVRETASTSTSATPPERKHRPRRRAHRRKRSRSSAT